MHTGLINLKGGTAMQAIRVVSYVAMKLREHIVVAMNL